MIISGGLEWPGGAGWWDCLLKSSHRVCSMGCVNISGEQQFDCRADVCHRHCFHRDFCCCQLVGAGKSLVAGFRCRHCLRIAGTSLKVLHHGCRCRGSPYPSALDGDVDERRLCDGSHRAAGSLGRGRLLANLEVVKEGGAEAIWLSQSAGGGLPLRV